MNVGTLQRLVACAAAARILAENPDFCCVNEVRDSAAHPEADALAAATGMHKTLYELLYQ